MNKLSLEEITEYVIKNIVKWSGVLEFYLRR